MRVAVIGANGQLGTDVSSAFRAANHEVLDLTHADLEVRDASGIESKFTETRADLVVNTSAMHNLEACEADPEMAYAVNSEGALNLARAGVACGFALMHVSTDYIFDGAKGSPYVETDAARPLNVYGRTKLQGEEFIQATLPKHFIVRTSGLYGRAPCRAKPSGSFVQLMLRLARERGEVRVVTDEIVTPTCTADVAHQIVTLAASGPYGVYHATCQGETSWFDFARAIFDAAGIQVHMHAAKKADFPQTVSRPSYSVLDNAALRKLGLDVMPHWRESLHRYLAG